MKIYSKVDPDTYYVSTTSYVRMTRNGDKLTIPNQQIPMWAERFNEGIKAELLEIYDQKHPLVKCPRCGKEFRKANTMKYCSPTCMQEVHREKARQRSKDYKKTLKQCEWCGENFHPSRYGKCCCKECHEKKRAADRHEEYQLETWESHLQEKLQMAEAQGMSYAEMQKQETLKMVGRVVI